MTPEGKVKAAIKTVLDKYRAYIYVYMPVPGGYGSSTLDYLGFCCGLGFAIEAKRPKGKPTSRQEGTIEDIRTSGARVFIVNDQTSLEVLDLWLGAVITAVTKPKQEPKQERLES
jgi:hypothetical protein